MSCTSELNPTEKRSEWMSRVRTEDTPPELAVRRLLHQMGYRYTVDNDDLPGTPDIANRTRKWAVFVHGCYWHHHEGCDRASIPKKNRDYWEEKFAKNKERDRRVKSELEEQGYVVPVVWECEVDSAPVQVATQLNHLLKERY